jgi:hypothetical protein
VRRSLAAVNDLEPGRGAAAASTRYQPPVAVVHLSADHAEPIRMQFIDATIEVMLVPKASVPGKARWIERDIWGVAGVYVLLGRAHGKALVRARPGSGHDVLARLRQHPAESPWFTRAVLARDTRQGWSSAETGYLEGCLHTLCRTSAAIEHDFRCDDDQTLQAHEQELLDRRYLPAIVAALNLAGAPIEMKAP